MSRIPSEGNYTSPRRVSRAASPSSLSRESNAGYGAASLPFTHQFYSRGERMAEQLMGALEGFGGVVAQAGAIRRREVAEQEAMDEHAKRQREIIESGQETENARRNLALYADKAKNGDLPVPMTDADVPDMVNHLIEQDTQGKSDFRKSEYHKAFAPRADQILYAYRDKNVKVARTETIDYARTAASKETTAEGMKAVRDKLMGAGLDVTDDEADKVVLDTMQTAALAGRQDQFEAAKEVLGGKFPEQTAHAQNTLEIRQNSERVVANRDFVNLASDMATREERPVPYSIQRTTLRAYAEEHPEVDESVVRTQLRAIDTAEKSAASEERKRMAPIVHESAKIAAVQGALPSLNNGRLAGHGFAALKDVEIPNASGTGTSTFTVKQQAEGAKDAVFAHIDQLAPGNTPLGAQTNLRLKLDWIAGTGDPDLRYEELSRQLNGAATMIEPTDTEQTVSPNAVQAFHAYQSGIAVNKALTEAHMEPDTRHLMSVAKLIHDHREGMSVAASLAAARREADRPPQTRMEPVSTDLAIKTLNSMGFTDKKGVPLDFATVRNGGAMVEVVRTLSMVNQAIGPMTQLDAVTLAGEQFKEGWANFGGYFVDRRARPVVDQIDKEAVSEVVSGYFAQTHPEEGADVVKNLGLRPDESGWSLSYLSPYWQSPTDAPRYTDTDLAEINYFIANQKAIGEHPEKEAEYQAIARSERTGGMAGKVFRTIDAIGSAIGGVPPSEFTEPAPVTPLDKPAELRPNNPALQGIFDFIKARESKPPTQKNTSPMPNPLFGPIRTKGT